MLRPLPLRPSKKPRHTLRPPKPLRWGGLKDKRLPRPYRPRRLAPEVGGPPLEEEKSSYDLILNAFKPPARQAPSSTSWERKSWT